MINLSVLTGEVSPRKRAVATRTNSVGILWMKLFFVVSEISDYVTKMPDALSFLGKGLIQTSFFFYLKRCEHTPKRLITDS